MSGIRLARSEADTTIRDACAVVNERARRFLCRDVGGLPTLKHVDLGDSLCSDSERVVTTTNEAAAYRHCLPNLRQDGLKVGSVEHVSQVGNVVIVEISEQPVDNDAYSSDNG